jgi:hypothetical protein
MSPRRASTKDAAVADVLAAPSQRDSHFVRTALILIRASVFASE